MNHSLANFEIKVENHLAFPHEAVISFGSCFPKDLAREGDKFHLQDRAGKKYPLAWRPLIRDEDGSTRWAHFSFSVELGRHEFKHFTVASGAVSPTERLDLQENENEIRIRNGDEEILFTAAAPLGLASFSHAAVLLLEGASAQMEFESGTYRVQTPLALSVRRANDFEIVVQAEGELKGELKGNEDAIYFRVLYTARLHRPGLDINVLFSNRRDNDEDLILQRLEFSFDSSEPLETCRIRQNSYDNMCVPCNHEIEGGIEIKGGALSDVSQIQLPGRSELWPFLKRFDREKFFGRVAPHAAVLTKIGGMLFCWERATMLETSAFSANEQTATLELVSPRDNGRRVPQGFSRSFDFSIVPLRGNEDGEEIFRLASCAEYAPLISVRPDWYIENEIEEMERMLPFRPDLYPRLERQLWREYAMDYFPGFYHTGDYASDRGHAHTKAGVSDITWNNNEEDHVKGIAQMLMRTGDPSYLEDLRLCARHLLEVDRVAYSSHSLQDGVFIAHAPNHFDGAGYPSHCWAEGALLYYKLCGDDDALEAFLKLCDWALIWKTTPDEIRFTDAREMGVPITNLAHAYVLTKDEKYLRGARFYIDEFHRQMDERGGLYYKKGAHFVPYAEYVAVEGLWDFYELVGGEDVKQLLLDIIEWIIRERLDFDGIYDARAINESFLHVFYIAWKLTGDEIWLDRGRRGLDTALSQSSLHPLLKWNNNGAFYHEAMKRGWLRDELVPLEPNLSSRAAFRQYSEPTFGWEK